MCYVPPWRHPAPKRSLLRTPLLAMLALLAMIVPALAAGSEVSQSQTEENLETFDFAWNLIRESYWDETFGGLDWGAVRDELRPQAAEAPDREALRSVLTDMLGRLGQSHFAVLPGDDQDSGAGGEEQLDCAGPLSDRLVAILSHPTAPSPATPGFDPVVIGEGLFAAGVAPGGAAARAGVADGWQIVAIDDVSVQQLVACLRTIHGSSEGEATPDEAMQESESEPQTVKPAHADSTPGHTARDLIGAVGKALLFGEEGTRVALVFEDASSSEHRLELERKRPKDLETVRFGNLPPLQFRFSERWIEQQDGATVRRIGLIRFNYWMMPVAKRFEESIQRFADADGIVLDLRGNPGGVAALAGGVAGYFDDQRDVLGTLETRRDHLRLTINPRLVTSSGERLDTFRGPLAILVDSGTASTSEIFAAGLQDLGRAHVLGERSAAAALPAVLDRLPNGDLLMHAIADLHRPNGERLEGIGVVPDQTVERTVTGLRRGVDEPLQAAVDWIVETAAASVE